MSNVNSTTPKSNCDLVAHFLPQSPTTQNLPCCLWSNMVTCDKNENIIKLNFNNSGMDADSFPVVLWWLKNLTSLSVGYNNWSTFPEALSEMTMLKSLDISGNLYKDIPKFPLLKLESLNLSHNPLERYDFSNLNIATLKLLDVTGNNPSSNALKDAFNIPQLNLIGGNICAVDGKCVANCNNASETSCIVAAPLSSDINSTNNIEVVSLGSIIGGIVVGCIFGLISIFILLKNWKKNARNFKDYKSVNFGGFNKGNDMPDDEYFSNTRNNEDDIGVKDLENKFVSPESKSAAGSKEILLVPKFAKGKILETGGLSHRFLPVVFPYDPTACDTVTEDELLLEAGDGIFVEKIFQDQWCLGWNHKTGHRGMFPLNSIAASTTVESKFKTIPFSYELNKPESPGPLNEILLGEFTLAKALCDYQDENADPGDPLMIIKVGDILSIEHFYEDGICFGYNHSNDQRGLFPIKICSLIHDKFIATKEYEHQFTLLKNIPSAGYLEGLKKLTDPGIVRSTLDGTSGLITRKETKILQTLDLPNRNDELERNSSKRSGTVKSIGGFYIPEEVLSRKKSHKEKRLTPVNATPDDYFLSM
ncbi:hypothetical protein HK099_006571 [Clydaea vesicula]|uniref:SH3 domain-containing protein n=1 Tax=Clydaea vesicula TaxID=447962 RepID=A0AAD5XU90_9FUNG|nr:hypothetical protein HK099_006571 [Clydaea vesicula]